MDMTLLLVVVAAVLAIVSFVFFGKMKAATAQALAEGAQRTSLDSKLNALRQEVSKLKEDNQRKNKLLDEARENARKKLRKEAQKEGNDGGVVVDDDSEIGRLKRTLSAMESQIRTMKESADQGVQAAKTALESEHQKELSALQNQIEKLEEALSLAKGESNKRRQQLSKQLATPVDLSTVPSEVVSELSRLMRKAEQHEKMHGILQGKQQLAQERYQELQRRYFAVCRELALVALPQTEATDEAAQKLAESVVEASDALAASHQAPAEHGEGSSHSEV
jgi:chromosome segregation ATPase